MAARQDRNYVSLWSWMWMIFVACIPCCGFVMSLIWAFSGDNETRKNYFRAVLLWNLIILALYGILFSLGFLPTIMHAIKQSQK